MDKKIMEKVDKKMKEGWIKVGMMIEAMAVSKDAVHSALEKHVISLEKEKNTVLYKKDFKGTEKVQKPLPNIPEGYSQVVDIEMIVENFDKLVQLVFSYGPSSIEILEPDEIRMDFGEAQGVLNTLAALVHRFAAMRAGGLLVKT